VGLESAVKMTRAMRMRQRRRESKFSREKRCFIGGKWKVVSGK
jgi:hypothetical protein